MDDPGARDRGILYETSQGVYVAQVPVQIKGSTMNRRHFVASSVAAAAGAALVRENAYAAISSATDQIAGSIPGQIS